MLDEDPVAEDRSGKEQGHDRGPAVERSPVDGQTLHDLEDEVERVLPDTGTLGHRGAKTYPGEDRLHHVAGAEVDMMLGGEVVEGDQVIPVPQQSVICFAEKLHTLCILYGCTNVECETELSVQSIKQPLRCGPVRCFAAEMNSVHA